MAKFTDRAAFVGETLTETFSLEDATSAKIVMADGTNTVTADATADGTSWTATANPSTLSGNVRWQLQVTRASGVTVEASGQIYLKPLVSKHRAVVAAIETALQNWGNNPNKQISVGELSITYKDREELVGLLSYWRSRADADEQGTTATSGPLILKGGFR